MPVTENLMMLAPCTGTRRFWTDLMALLGASHRSARARVGSGESTSRNYRSNDPETPLGTGSSLFQVTGSRVKRGERQCLGYNIESRV